MSTAAGGNDLAPLKFSHLKMHANAEYNTFVNADKKAGMDHCEEGHNNQFSQFARGAATLKTRTSIKLLV